VVKVAKIASNGLKSRLQELSEIFAVGVCGFAVMDSHFHVVLQLNDAVAAGWSDEEVVRRWGRLFPPRGKDRQPLQISDAWVEQRLKDAAWVAIARERLNSLSWFMKCVKEPLARLANKQDDCRGTFWEARYKSIAILDEEALLQPDCRIRRFQQTVRRIQQIQVGLLETTNGLVTTGRIAIRPMLPRSQKRMGRNR